MRSGKMVMVKCSVELGSVKRRGVFNAACGLIRLGIGGDVSLFDLHNTYNVGLF